MQCVRPNFSAGRAASRSRISNRSRLLPGVDGRSAAARRFRDICRNYELEAGGDVSEDLRNLELSLRCGRQMQEPISIGHRGEHQPIVDRKLFDAVQEVQAKQRNNHVAVIEKSEALLIGLIYDDRGHRMTPVVAKKNGKQYRYYISSALHQGKQDEAGSVTRVPADQIEALVVEVLKARGLIPANLNNGRELIRSMLVRVEVAAKTIKVSAKNRDDEHQDGEGADRQFNVSTPPRRCLGS